jgi:hypothetical protein
MNAANAFERDIRELIGEFIEPGDVEAYLNLPLPEFSGQSWAQVFAEGNCAKMAKGFLLLQADLIQ